MLSPGGHPTPSTPKLAVIGAGVAGLSAARELMRLGGDSYDVVVFEASDRLGGRVRQELLGSEVIDVGAQWYLSPAFEPD